MSVPVATSAGPPAPSLRLIGATRRGGDPPGRHGAGSHDAVVKEMAEALPNARRFWSTVKEKGGSVVANIGLDGTEYRKYGTTFGNQIVVIGKAKREGQPFIGAFQRVEDAWAAVEAAVARERDADPERPLASTPGAGGAVPEPVPGKPGRDRTRTRNQQPDAVPGVGITGMVDQTNRQGEPPAGSPASNPGGQPEQRGDAPNSGAVNPEGLDTDDFTGYRPIIPAEWGAKAHPAPLVETAAMSAVKFPYVSILASCSARGRRSSRVAGSCRAGGNYGGSPAGNAVRPGTQ